MFIKLVNNTKQKALTTIGRLSFSSKRISAQLVEFEINVIADSSTPVYHLENQLPKIAPLIHLYRRLQHFLQNLRALWYLEIYQRNQNYKDTLKYY